MFGALFYLRIASFWNMLAARLRRLRQPKYFVGAVAIGAYFYYYFLFRRMTLAGHRGASPSATGLTIFAGAAFLFIAGAVRIAIIWAGPTESPGLLFSEPEIAFLFPAPITRRTLVHFRLLGPQFRILVTSLVAAVLTSHFRFGGGLILMRTAGWWVMFSVFDLHMNGAALTLARVKERGGSLHAWRLGSLAILGLYLAALIGSLYVYGRTPEPADLAGVGAMRAYVSEILAAGPLPWLLLPFRVVAGPFMAPGFREFAQAMVPALLVVAAHYAWVVRTETAFEEGSIAAAERATAAHGASDPFDEGRLPVRTAALASAPARPVREPFHLGPRGRPEVAFLWKNILSIQGSFFTPAVRRMGLAIAIVILLGIRSLLSRSADIGKMDMSPLVIGASGLMAFYTLLLGPQLARQDLRGDLPNADILKTYPLEGWKIALGELLAPAAILTALLWLAILAPALLVGSESGAWLTPALRFTGALCLGTIAPVLCLIQLLAPNLLMILFPAWYQTSRTRAGGVEAMGQRLLFVFAQLLVAIFAVVPAVLAGALVAFASQWILGPAAAAILATLSVLVVLGGEAAVGVWILGHRFERLDLSVEFKP